MGDIAFAVVVVAGILVLTQKDSQGANVINAIGGSFSSAIQSAIGAKPKLAKR